jgi:ABC-type nitrate/sulfonate/bicarbonate transport system substrate-binding protein
MVSLAPSALVEALVDGTVDAACLYPPFSDQALDALGPNLFAWPAQLFQDYYYLLTVRDRYLREHPAVIEALLGAVLDADAFVRRSPPAAQNLVAEALGIAPEIVARRWKRMSPRVSLSEDLLTLMGDEARWIVDRGWGDPDRLPNAYSLVHYETLERLSPAAVGIIH